MCILEQLYLHTFNERMTAVIKKNGGGCRFNETSKCHEPRKGGAGGHIPLFRKLYFVCRIYSINPKADVTLASHPPHFNSQCAAPECLILTLCKISSFIFNIELLNTCFLLERSIQLLKKLRELGTRFLRPKKICKCRHICLKLIFIQNVMQFNFCCLLRCVAISRGSFNFQ